MNVSEAPFKVYEWDKVNKGSFGEVCRGRLTKSGEPVVIKIAQGSSVSCDSLRNEYKILASVSHPSIITVYGIIDHYNYVSFAMEMADCSLFDMLLTPRYCRGLPPKLFIDLLNDTALGFRYLRGKGVVHRDTKPANILVFPRISSKSKSAYCFKLCDFGGSKEITTEDQLMNTLVGTRGYLTPQMVEHIAKPGGAHNFQVPQGYEASSDLWCLGATLYQAATGQLPFPSDAKEADIVLKNRPPGAGFIAGDIRGDGKKCVYATKVNNQMFPRWLIDCVSTVISSLLDERSFDKLFSMSNEIFNMRVFRVVSLDKMEVVEYADLSNSINFRHHSSTVHSIDNLSEDREWCWLGTTSRTITKKGEKIYASQLPSDESILFPIDAKIVTEKKEWNPQFVRPGSVNESHERGYNRRRQILHFGWNSLLDTEKLIDFFETCIRILKSQIVMLLSTGRQFKERSERGERFSQFSTSFGSSLVLCTQNDEKTEASGICGVAQKTVKEFTASIERVRTLLTELSKLSSRVDSLSIEESPMPRAEAQLTELESLSVSATKRKHDLDPEIENWLYTLCSQCCDRRLKVAKQIKQLYNGEDGLLSLIRFGVDCSELVHQMEENLRNSESLMETCVANEQRLANQVLMNAGISLDEMKRSVRMIKEAPRYLATTQAVFQQVTLLEQKMEELLLVQQSNERRERALDVREIEMQRNREVGEIQRKLSIDE